MTQPAHIAFFSGTVASHVYPMLAIAEELAGRGHRVSFTTTEAYAPAVLAAGVRAVIPPARSGSARSASDFFGIPLLLLDEAMAVLPDVEAAYTADPPDIVLTEDPASAGGIMAAKWGVPTVQVWPFLATTRHWTAKYGRDHPQVDELLSTLTRFLRAQGVDRTAEEHYARGVAGGIVLLPRSFQPAADEFGGLYTFVGPCLGTREPGTVWPADSVLDRPHVLVSLGSINNGHPGFYRMCAQALAGVGYDVVMSVGSGVDVADLGPLPPNVSAYPWVAQLRSLRTAAAFVCHAGMNSLMEAFRHAVPVVAVPRTPEQVANARRVLEMGLGRALSPKKVTAPALRDAVAGVIGSESMRRRIADLRREMVAAGGAHSAADAVEARIKGDHL